MARLLAIGAIAWPLFLASGLWTRAHGGPAWVTVAVYVSASRVCHQRPERSFQSAGVTWPVCGRCAGLYLAAPLGAIAAIVRRRRGGPRLAWLFVAAVPTALTLAVEFFNVAPVSSLVRAWSAVPLGAAVAFVLVTVAKR